MGKYSYIYSWLDRINTEKNRKIYKYVQWGQSVFLYSIVEYKKVSNTVEAVGTAHRLQC